jgi:hypothetical protein
MPINLLCDGESGKGLKPRASVAMLVYAKVRSSLLGAARWVADRSASAPRHDRAFPR